jgi:hypothetical protein
MRLVISLLTTVCFITATEANATGLATPQYQAAFSAPKPTSIDIIKQPSLLRQKLAGNCTTTCQWIGPQQFCNTHCFSRNRTLRRSLSAAKTLPWETLEGICFRRAAQARLGWRFSRFQRTTISLLPEKAEFDRMEPLARDWWTLPTLKPARKTGMARTPGKWFDRSATCQCPWPPKTLLS